MGPAYPGAKRSGVTPEPVEPMTITQAAVEATLGALCGILKKIMENQCFWNVYKLFFIDTTNCAADPCCCITNLCLILVKHFPCESLYRVTFIIRSPLRIAQEPLLKVRTGGFQYFDAKGAPVPGNETAALVEKTTTARWDGMRWVRPYQINY